MLSDHFGSKEGLWVAIVRAAVRRDDAGVVAAHLRSEWACGRV